MPLTAGTRLGPYEIVAALGAGGMGEVYRATDTRLGREVAIKVLPADVASDPDRLSRFEREAKAVSALNHPNIITLYEVGTSSAGPYLVLEKIEGRSLRDFLADGPLPIRRILTLVAQIAEGVAKAHAAGIVHRDLKPDNIMVTEDGFAKVLDFGLAKLVAPELRAAPIDETTLVNETRSGMILGTLGYVSPEQASGKPADYRADQFALGALMYEMATRDRPFKRATMLESLAATIRDEPEPVRSKRADVPAPFAWIIERCLAKDPNDRYASTSDLARDLASLRDRLSDLTRGPAIETPGRTRERPRKLVGWAIAAAVLAGVGAAGYVLGRQGSPATVPSYRALTFQRGIITGARFGSDGKTVYYSMAHGGGPSRVYVTRTDRFESNQLEIPPGFLLTVSNKDELGMLLTNERASYAAPGTFARVPAIGGTPRPLIEGVTYADWSADGEHIAIQRANGPCEFPIGRAVTTNCALPRVSPDGKNVAFSTRNGLVVQSATGERIASSNITAVFGLAWTRDGREVWYTGSEGGSPHDRALYALSLDGRNQLLARAPGSLAVWDVSPDGRSALINTGAGWFGINARIADDREERSLDLLGRSEIVGLSADVTRLLVNETREVGPGAYLKTTDGAQTFKLNGDIAYGLSPDGAWALVLTRGEAPRLKLISTGAAGERDLAMEAGLRPVSGERAQWSRVGQRVFLPMFASLDNPRSVRAYMYEEGRWRPITPAGGAGPFVVSPAGDTVAMKDDAGVVKLYSSDGRPPTPLAGETGIPVHWSADGRSLFLRGPEQFPARVYRRDLTTGRVEAWRMLAPADPSGIMLIGRILIADDDRSYVYQYNRALNELFLASNLR